jgi:hypothetical protein
MRNNTVSLFYLTFLRKDLITNSLSQPRLELSLRDNLYNEVNGQGLTGTNYK